VSFQYRVICNFFLIPEHSADLAAFPVGVAINTIAVFGVKPAPRNEEPFAVLAFLDEDVMFDHLYELEMEQVFNGIDLI